MARKNKIEVLISAKNKLSRELTKIGYSLKGTINQVASLRTGIVALTAGYGLQKLASGFIEVGSSVDQMKISLDTITKGDGEAWFKRLNEWALKMPVNTEKAIKSFTMMRAMGLQPTIKDMTTLVDTTSALGGQSDTLEGIARALGQIKTKGKVSAEELMQLAERGVPAYEILKEKLSLTSDELNNLAKSGTDAGVAVNALLEGMADRFGGQSAKIQMKWAGLTESLKSYWTEFRRMVMGSGVMEFLEKSLARVISKLDEMYKSGEMDKWAKKVAIGTLEAFKSLLLGTQKFAESFVKIWRPVKNAVSHIINAFNEMPGWMQKAGVIGALLFGRLGVAALIAGIEVYRAVSLETRGWIAIMKGELEASDLLGKSYEEASKKLEELAKKKETIARGQVVRGKIVYPGTTGAVVQSVVTEIDKIITKVKAAGEGVAEKVISIGNNAVEASKDVTAETEQATIERLTAYKTMYDTLSDWGYSDYSTQLELIDLQKKEFIKATNDKVLAEKWASAERQKTWEKDRLKFGDFKDGIIVAYEQMKRNAISFAEVAFNAFNSFVESSKSVFSDIFYDGMIGKLKSLKDYWKDFWYSIARTAADSISQMVTNWLFGLSRMSGGGSLSMSAMGGLMFSGTGGGSGGGGGGLLSNVLSIGSAAKTGLSAYSSLSSAGSSIGNFFSTGGGLFSTASVAESSNAFFALSKVPGMSVVRGPSGATLAFKGVPLGNYFTAAGLGSIGYGTIGKWIGLPQSKYSGYTAAAGAMGGMALGASYGSWGGPIGAAAGAIIGGITGGLFGSSKKKHAGTYAWDFGLNDRQLDITRIMGYGRSGNIPLPSNYLGFQTQLNKVFASFDKRFEAYPAYIQEAMQPVIEATEEHISTTIFSRYIDRQRRQGKALIYYFNNDYLPAIKSAYNSIIEATYKMAQELFESVKELLVTTLSTALQQANAMDAWENFSLGMRESIYNNIVSGVVDALAESAIYQQTIAPVILAISSAFSGATTNGVFNAGKFQELVSPALSSFQTNIQGMAPAFSSAYDVVRSVRESLFPEMAAATSSEAPFYMTPEGEKIFMSPTQAAAASVIVDQLQIMPHANIDEALFDKPLDWWIELAKSKVLPALNELGEAGALTSLQYEAA